MFREQAPVFFFDEQPQGWLPRAVAQIETTNEELLYNRSQDAAWKKTTGVAVEDSHLTLIMPIHNEERCLPSVLGALMVANIPSEVDLHVILITNGCTDESPQMVSTFLDALGESQEITVSNQQDDIVIRFARQTSRGSIRFTHIDTPCKGKSLALALGVGLAEANHHDIVMSMDANNWPEPDSIMYMFKAAHENFEHHVSDHTVGVISARARTEFRPSPLTTLLSRAKRSLNGASQKPAHTVDGGLMAWPLSLTQPFPKVISDDYTLSLLARRSGKTVRHVDAQIWGFEPNNLTERFWQYIRAVRGILQLKEFFSDPQVNQMIQEDWYVMRPLSQKIAEHIKVIRENGASLPYRIAMFIMWEVALRLGAAEYRRDPDNLSWRPSASTK